MALLRRVKVAQSEFFPGFTDIAEIGIGSLATVYRAREIGTNRIVALKLLNLLNLEDASARVLESFEREAMALGTLSSHPHIVTLFRSFRAADGRPVLVLELCGGSIGAGMPDGHGLAVPEVVSMGIKIAGALETAHRAKILHRDVKPQNILITDFGEPALADFGVAMLQSSTQTTAGLFDFTALHTAPELLEGGTTSPATDVYELASSLYQLIAGRSAFRAQDGESPASVILRILRDPVQPLVAAQVPTHLSDLLISAMSKDVSERPPTAAEFAAGLATIETEQGWSRTRFLVRDPAPPPPILPRPPLVVAPMPIAPTPPKSARPVYPIPPVATAPAVDPAPPAGLRPPLPGPAPQVPTWSLRASAPAAAPAGTGSSDTSQFVTDIALDPMTLRRRVTIRAGASALVVDDDRIQLRVWWRRTEIPWSDVVGFETRFEGVTASGTGGRLVVLTARGPVDLPATKRTMPDVRHVHALLDAYRIRSQMLADR